MKTRYEFVKKRRNEWILQKYYEDFREDRGGCGTRIIMTGTKKECQDKLREMEGEKESGRKNQRARTRISKVRSK